MIISFSKTIKLASLRGQPEPLSSGVKTVTRRLWKLKTFNFMIKAFERGDRTHQAWSNCSYVKGAYCLGLIELVQLPYREKLEDMPEEDLYHEGNLWDSKEEFIKMVGCDRQILISVIRFKFHSLSH